MAKFNSFSKKFSNDPKTQLNSFEIVFYCYDWTLRCLSQTFGVSIVYKSLENVI